MEKNSPPTIERDSRPDQNEAILLERAHAANAADHALTWWKAIFKYRKAVFWACIFSFTLTMQSADATSTTSFYGQTQFKERFGTVDNGVLEISAKWQTGIQQAMAVGELIGLAIAGILADRLGWKPILSGMMVWLTGSLFLFAFAQNLGMMVAAMVLCGIPWGAFQTGCIAYSSEMVPTCLRPFVTAWIGICWGLGFFIGSLVNRGCLNLIGQWAWRVPFLVQFVWPVPLLICFLLAPESPYYLVRKGRYEDARATLRRIRQKDITDEEIEQSIALIDYTNKMEIQIKESSSYAECFRGKNRWRTEIVCIVQIAQAWGGNGINVQTVQFLEQAGLSEQGAFDLNLILNSQYLTFGLFCIWLMTKFGRATIFTTGLVLSDVFLVAIGVLGCVKQSTAVSNTVGSLLLVSTVIYISTVAPSSYTIIGEVPSSKLRAKMVSLARVAFNVSSLISNVLLPKMLTGGSWNLGAKTAFMFAGTNALIWIWCIFRLPETKDRTFREIDYLFEESGLHPRQWRTARIDVFDDDNNGPGIVVSSKEKDFQHVENAL
ncbi:MFS general substrate transporter [Aspergillus costaricaensis CBS 115574]|uniref:MFS general substrate transporter n=1 Tax=Aspergillus costaricaensis CBS 115574 TaxID=1448317 RepID=A0ACD1IPP9_9EURO|nr:MFS general substrate transporter [Aspergillus costaricaensis CBS 115574]RAK91730.1 MFS general substrate transporter [Aspergillus costaricaensis CBS 115574]